LNKSKQKTLAYKNKATELYTRFLALKTKMNQTSSALQAQVEQAESELQSARQRAEDLEREKLWAVPAGNEETPNTWDPVLGGHIQAGSTPTQTVLEELAGEIGLSLSPSNLVGGSVIKADKGLDKEFNHIFACPFPEHAVVDFRDHEVQKVRWMGLDEVLEALRISPAEWRPTLAEFSAAHSIATSLIKK
jgi:8-oxo-dGTP pyrophosphatase MutT (NUDIX family)